MMNITKQLMAVIALLSTGLLAMPAGATAEVVVIGHPGLPFSAISADDVQNLFLGKSDTFKGVRITVADQKEGNAARDEFYQKIAGKNPQQLRAYWAKLVFTGQAMPPKAMADDEAVKSWVASTPGAVGYISRSAVDGSVKTLLKQ